MPNLHANSLELQSVFDACFDSVERLVLKRQKTINYDWLMDPVLGAFFPDYFTIGSVGRHWGERWLNRLLSNRFGRFGLSYRVVSRFVALFYELPNVGGLGHRQWLLNQLQSMLRDMREWTLIEFFLFMERWMRGVASNDAMSFSSEKRALNQMVLPMIDEFDVLDVSDGALVGAIYAACYANWLDVVVPDYNERAAGTLALIRSSLAQTHQVELPDLVGRLADSNKIIVYECDNAGEVVIDLMVVIKLILRGHQVVLVGKYSPILNDVTVSDIRDLIHSDERFLCLKKAMKLGSLRIIYANDFPMIGKFLPLATKEYQTVVKACDLIFLKGQANFQTMPMINYGRFKQRVQYKKPILLNFVVKTPMVRYCLDRAVIGNVELGDPLVKLI